MTQDNDETEKLPDIFDSVGGIIELTDEQAATLSEEAYQKYARVADAYDAVLVIEKKMADVTAELRARVGDLREAERAVATLPKPSHVDLVRTLSRQTAGR